MSASAVGGTALHHDRIVRRIGLLTSASPERASRTKTSTGADSLVLVWTYWWVDE